MLAAAALAAAGEKPRPKGRPKQAARQDPVPAERPEATGIEPSEAPKATGGNPPTRPAALKRPAVAGPVHAVAVPVHKHHAKSAAASPARTKPAPATKGLPRGWRTQVSVR